MFKICKFVIASFLFLLITMVVIQFISTSKISSLTSSYSIYDTVNIYDTQYCKTGDMHDKLVEIMDLDQSKQREDMSPINNTSVASSSGQDAVNALIGDEDAQKLADWFNSKASGPCTGLGQYVVAKAKELNVSPFYGVIVPGIESTWGKACAKTNNFAGINSSSGFRSFNTPEECADIMLQSIANYRDKAEFGNIDITNISEVAKKYCMPPDPWVSSANQLINEASSATGVQPDIH